MGRLRDAISSIDTECKIWIAERDAPEMRAGAWSHLEIIDRCLDEIDASECFLLVLGPRLGTNAALGARQLVSSFVELELFYAVMSAKPLLVFSLAGSELQSDLSKLLDTLTVGARETQVFSGSQSEIVNEIARLLERRDPVPTVRSQLPRVLSGYLASERHTDFQNTALFKEIEFLRGEPVGVVDPHPEIDLIRECLSDLQRQERTDRKMSRAWLAIRLLMGRHYRSESDDEILKLWEEVMRAWSQFASWRGLHSHLWLGHIASLGSLYHITQRREQNIALPTNDEHGGNLFGALASVYYSLSKVAREDHRSSFEDRSLSYLNSGLNAVEWRRKQGLYAVRAAVRLHQRKYGDAIGDFKSALEIAESVCAEPTAIAMLEADLGFAEVRSGRILRGRSRLEKAVDQIIASDVDPGFKIRSLRKLAVTRFLTISPICGYTAAREASILIERHRVLDQQDALTRAVSKLDRFVERLLK